MNSMEAFLTALQGVKDALDAIDETVLAATNPPQETGLQGMRDRWVRQVTTMKADMQRDMADAQRFAD